MAASMVQKHNLFCRISLQSIVRTFYSCTRLKNEFKESKTMKKILNKANRKKDTRWYAPIYEQKSGVTFKGPAKLKRKFSEGMVRRANYVGDVLYEAVSQIISSGQIGVTVTVTQVKVLPDMSHMNIYWEASGIQEKDKQTQIALDQNAKLLRHLLIDAQALGNVPRPVFVKDISISQQKQVEELLHRISLENQNEPDVLEEPDSDMNEDISLLKTDSDNELDVQLEQQEVLTSENELDSHLHKDRSVENVEAEFRQDLYDLHHDVLMKKVVLAKVSAIQRPSIVSDTKSKGENYIKFEDNLKTKFFNPKKVVSKKKLLRQIEREEIYKLEHEMKNFDEMEDNDGDIDNDNDAGEEDYTRIDSYIERFYKVTPTEGDKTE